MSRQRGADKINIRPGVGILSVLRHLNYRFWYAIAEFVDNSVQSYLSNDEALRRADGDGSSLAVSIELDTADDGRIVIRDNAAGIGDADYHRAFRPAEAPLDRSGLSEFGMGMKSAACWLARQWTVRTKALGEKVEKTVSFDVEEIVQGRIEDLAVAAQPCDPSAHYTEVVLEGLHKIPQGRTLTKIREHLASIYRVFLRQGTLRLTYNGDPLAYHEAPVLTAPFYKTPTAPPVLWRKEIDFDFGDGQHARGFAALFETGSTSRAGFALFRRNRLIEGSGDEGYRPEAIFGKSNSYRYQRLFGELHLEGFEVSHTKDGFRWEEHEEVFLQLLGEYLDADPLPLLAQAEGFRSRPARQNLAAAAQTAVDRTADVVEQAAPAVLTGQIEAGPDPAPPPPALPPADTIARSRELTVPLRGETWVVTVEMTNDQAVGEWLTISDQPTPPTGEGPRRLGLRLSLAHPFMDRFAGSGQEQIEALLRVAVAIGLGETTARETGTTNAGKIRRTVNELLRNALANP